MKPFDDKFADNVREVFDAWDEPADEQAWLMMKARLQPAAKKKALLAIPLWLRAAAAVFVLGLLGVSAWMFLQPSSPLTPLASESIQPDPLDPALGIASSDASYSHSLAEEVPEGVSHHTAEAFIEPVTLPVQPSLPAKQQQQPVLAATTDTPTVLPDVLLPTDLQTEQQGLAEVTVHQPTISEEEQKVNPNGLLPVLPTDEQIIRENMAMLSDEPLRPASFVELSAGTMKTWTGSEIAGGMGLAAGVSGQWPLGQRFSLSSGGSLVYNQFSINEEGSSRSRLMYDAIHSMPNFDMADHIEVIDRQVSTDFEFMALDIPLNVRYAVREMNRSSIFVSAGISSLLYLQQNYQTQTDVLAELSGMSTQGDYFSNTNSVSSTQTGDFGLFSRFDFARFLNLSAGYVIRGKSHSLVIEPYMKYPLGGVTSLNFHIGMAGVSLKFRPELY
ncbi:MAG: hypothetical protein ACK4VN_08365 [Bacteroidales bacterium]